MASLVLILSELVCPHSQNTKPDFFTTSSSFSSCAGAGAGAATAFPARKPLRYETNRNNNSSEEMVVENLEEPRISVESVWP
uniref:Uncharacterized protein n=1 Tax=Fagus sylvatica TaxID=28930 RepID=A0A2N9IFE3_FAGSY